MPDIPEFQRKQYEFAAHIRDPQHHPAPAGIEDRRMAIYRNLFFNNLSSLLARTFPVMKKIHTAEHWNAFIRGFMQRHSAQTPYFLQLPGEFLAYLQNEYEPGADDFPFLLELAHYESIELELSISEASNDLTDVDPDGDLLAGTPVKSNLAMAFAYQYPVHRVSPSNLPTEPPEQATFLCIYRRANDEVGFLELNPMTAALFEAVENNPTGRTGQQLLRELATATQFPDVDAFVAHGRDALEEMRQLEILTGARPPTGGDPA